jgi:putative transcriptional regulator
MTYMIKPGDLLVAPPSIPDDRFSQAVMLVTDHDDRGSVALCLNRATEYMVNDLITPLNVEISWDPVLFWGGPVCQDINFMLHTPEWYLSSYTRPLNRAWSVTQHWSMFTQLSTGFEPESWRIFAGCAVWAPGQLARELVGQYVNSAPSQGWLVVKDPDVALVLSLEPEDVWTWACDLVADQSVATWMC